MTLGAVEVDYCEASHEEVGKTVRGEEGKRNDITLAKDRGRREILDKKQLQT